MKRLSWRYLAGLIDGEGCIDFQFHAATVKGDKRLYITPRLRLALTDSCRFMLDQIHANHGGNVWLSKKSKQNPNWQDAWYWQLQGKKLRPFLQNIVKHLYIKKEQIKFSIWWIDNVMGKESVNRNSDFDGNELRQFARDELKAMKVDPQRLSEVAVNKITALNFGLWSPHSNYCLECRTTKVKHEANGLCKPCYDKIRWREKAVNH